MEVRPSPHGSADPQAEVERLRRQLEQEHARRVAAESLGEKATAELYESVRELRSAQTELIERADQSRLVNELARSLRQDLDSQQLVNRAAEAVGRATNADRCEVLIIDAEPTSAVRGSWSTSEEAAALPSPESFVELPEVLTTLMIEAAQRLGPIQIDHIEEDERFDPGEAAELVAALGIRALAAVPVAVGDEVVGWMMLQSIVPRPWLARELGICESLSHDLVASLIQVRAFEDQRESVRRLQELDHDKDAFISTVSHELRTPLTSIVGYLELMSDGGMGVLTDELSQGVQIIERNVGRLRALVEDLLQHSAYDAGKVRLDLQPLDLAEMVEECRQNLAPAIAERQLVLEVHSDLALPQVLGDREQLERVVLNLLSNAVKFSHEGHRIDVRLGADTGADTGAVVLAVSDTGIGIPAEEQERIFSRFFRSSLAVTGEIQGTGLGLSLVQTVVDWHHGTVEVESVEGQGTTVTVTLPQAT